MICLGTYRYWICNNKKFGLTLPPYKTKRKMYEQYCFNNGWKVRHTPRGGYAKLSDYTLRPNDDHLEDMALWPTGSIFIPVCTYHTFCSLWKKFFPLMKICSPSKDICLQYHVFKNQFKFNAKQAKAKKYDTYSDNIEDDMTENIILKAAIHVRQTSSQR